MRARRTAWALVLGTAMLLWASASPARAQPLPLRQATVTAGLGNAQGWVGLQGEYYFVGDRLSAFGAAGYTPRFELGAPSGPTFAGGVRAYTGGSVHRAFLELSGAQMLIQRTRRVRTGSGRIATVEGNRRYGPGLQAGYQYVAGGGFTLMASTGAGYTVGKNPRVPGGPIRIMVGLGVGYTWR